MGTRRQLDLGLSDPLVGNGFQQVRDAVQPRPPLVVGADDVPRRMFRAGRLQHQVAGAGVAVPAPEGFGIHRAQLPLPQRIVDPRAEAALMLLLPYLEPNLAQDDTAVDDMLFHLGAWRPERLVVLLRAAGDPIFAPGAIV